MKLLENIGTIEIGKQYHFEGDIYNGNHADGTQRITKERVTRPVSAVLDDCIVCACSRRFIINDNLKVYLVGYESYDNITPCDKAYMRAYRDGGNVEPTNIFVEGYYGWKVFGSDEVYCYDDNRVYPLQLVELKYCFMR